MFWRNKCPYLRKVLIINIHPPLRVAAFMLYNHIFGVGEHIFGVKDKIVLQADSIFAI